jgi:hypothetical protein
MLQILRNGLIPLLVSGCCGVAGCSPAPRQPIERSSDPRLTPPEKRALAVSSSSAGDPGVARSTEPRPVTHGKTLALDGGDTGPKAAIPPEAVINGGAQPSNGGVQPTAEGTAKAAAEDDPEAETFTVPDCQGGKTVAPIWIRHVPFWAALCVHGLSKNSLRVDVGTSLVAHANLDDGTAANRFQVYYALEQVLVPPNDKGLIWAMCGGAGEWLLSGTRVIPTHRLPAKESRVIAEHIDTLKTIENDLVMFKQSFRAATTAIDKNFFKSKLDELNVALTDAAGLLRDAVIKENRMVLSRSSVPGGPPAQSPNPLHRPLGGPPSVVPPPKIHPKRKMRTP